MQPRDYRVVAVGVVVLIVAVAGSFGMAQKLPEAEARGPMITVDLTGSFSTDGTAQEGETVDIPLPLADTAVTWVTVNLTWADEPDSARHTNQPDSFTISLLPPNGDPFSNSGANPQGQPGAISVEYRLADGEKPMVGDWNVTITMDTAGDQRAMFSILGLRDQADSGNAWNVETSFAGRLAGVGGG